MSLTVAIQMDPIDSINIATDSTFALALEAQIRGYTLFYYLPQHLSFRQGQVYTEARLLSVQPVKGYHFTLGSAQKLDLCMVDVILMRQDPPFDMAYITATHLLEQVHPNTLVVNNPRAVRNAPEKLFVTHFADLIPPTLITSCREEIHAFRREFHDIILKPLFGNGGTGVFHLKPDDENLGSLLEQFAKLYREPIVVQQYLPAVRNGDKRIILVDGEAVGGIVRIPQEGEARANLHSGGSAHKAELNNRDREICSAIGPILRSNGLVFVGIDVIGDWLTEINVTSPTGIHEVNRLDGVQIEKRFWDVIETSYLRRQNNSDGYKLTDSLQQRTVNSGVSRTQS
jgi:glutathione synthase